MNKRDTTVFTPLAIEELTQALFGKVDWRRLQASGLVWTNANNETLANAQQNLDSVLMSPSKLSDLLGLYLYLANNCTQDVGVQHYVFARFEEILASNSLQDLQSVAHVIKVLNPNNEVNDGPFLRALANSNADLQKSAAKALALIYTNLSDNTSSQISHLVYWIESKLNMVGQDPELLDTILPSARLIVSNRATRVSFLNENALFAVSNTLRTIGVRGNPQHIYELVFILWNISLGMIEGTGKLSVSIFTKSGCVPPLVDLVTAASSRKVTRMTIATLHNLAKSEDDVLLTAVFTTNLWRLLESMLASLTSQSGKAGVMRDPELEEDVKGLHDILTRNHRELSTFDRWEAEVNAGALAWGILHTEKFWKENYRSLEKDDWSMLKKLVDLLDSPARDVVCVALYDIGEFTRLYPNGRVVTTKVGGKNKALKLVQSPDDEVQKHALQCISKVMIGWDMSQAS